MTGSLSQTRGRPERCPKCGRGRLDFDASRVDELSAEQARDLHRALAFYGYCTPSVPESSDGGEPR